MTLISVVASWLPFLLQSDLDVPKSSVLCSIWVDLILNRQHKRLISVMAVSIKARREGAGSQSKTQNKETAEAHVPAAAPASHVFEISLPSPDLTRSHPTIFLQAAQICKPHLNDH